MITVLTWLLWILLGLLGLVLVILATPIVVRVNGLRTPGDARVRGYGGLPFGMLGGGFEIDASRQCYRVVFLGLTVWTGDLWGAVRRGRAKKKEKSRSKPTKSHKKTRRLQQPMETFTHVLRAPYLGTVAGRLLKLIVRGNAEGRIGFDDPVATARLSTAVCALESVMPGALSGLEVDFTEEVFEGRVRVQLFIWVPYILIGGLWILLGREGRALIRHLYASRRSRAGSAESS